MLSVRWLGSSRMPRQWAGSSPGAAPVLHDLKGFPEAIPRRRGGLFRGAFSPNVPRRAPRPCHGWPVSLIFWAFSWSTKHAHYKHHHHTPNGTKGSLRDPSGLDQSRTHHPHHPEAHCDSACGLYSTTLVLIPLDAHFVRLKIGYAHRDKAKYPPYDTEGVQ